MITGEEGDFYGRLRDVTVGPDGFIYVVTNRSKVVSEPSTGLLLRIRPRRITDDRAGSPPTRGALTVLPVAGCDTKAYPADTQLAKDVAARFSQDPVLGDLDIEITASRGIIYLSSQETTRPQRELAVKVAGEVRGVRWVFDKMR